MKRLFLVLGLMTVGAVFAARSTDFNFGFPYYAAVFTNVQTVEFFTNSSGNAGTLSDNGNYYEASASGLVSCLEDKASSLPNSYQINGSGGATPSIVCDFYPNSVASDSSFSVSGYTGLSPAAASDDDATDGELLVITNSSSFSVSTSVSGSVPTGMTLKLFAGYQAGSDKNVYKKGGSLATASSLNDFAPDATVAFDTEYSFAKVIPLIFFTSVDVLNTAYIDPGTPTTVTVTWNGSAP